MRRLTDTEAMDNITAFLNRPGPWNGGDVCEVVAEQVDLTGRDLLDNADDEEES